MLTTRHVVKIQRITYITGDVKKVESCTEMSHIDNDVQRVAVCMLQAV